MCTGRDRDWPTGRQGRRSLTDFTANDFGQDKKGKTAAQIAEELDIEPGEVQFLAELIQRHPGMSCEDLCAIEISTAV